MIPDQCPPDITSSGEKILYGALANGLDQEYTVIHSLPWLDPTGRRLHEGECDFLVLHPTKGMLAIEAKSGAVRYDSSGRWYWLDGKPLNNDPYEQAQGCVHHLNNILKSRVPSWEGEKRPFGHAVAFPECGAVVGQYPPEAGPEITILSRDLNAVQQKIDRILARYNSPAKHPLDPATMDLVVEAILPHFSLTVTPAVCLKSDRETIVRLTEQQKRYLDATEHERRLVVEGVAGSGKTMLAIEKAARLSAQGARVLLLCYNDPLADMIAEQVKAKKLSVDVYSFHGLCKHVVTATGGKFTVPTKDKEDFYNNEAPDLLDRAIGAYPKRYDALIVDEGQDFMADWWISIENLLADKEKAHFYIFLDSRQNLYGRELVLPFSEHKIKLTENCRNTVCIAKKVHSVLGLDAKVPEFAPTGEPPVEVDVQDELGEWEETRKAIHALVAEKRVEPNRIAIIGPRKFENTLFAKRPALGNCVAVDTLRPGKANEICYSTVYRFKGLEADCIIALDHEMEPARRQEQLERLYVAASRARLLLWVIHRRKS
jgi:hypothetical protein